MAPIWLFAIILSTLVAIGIFVSSEPGYSVDNIRTDLVLDPATGVMIGTSRMGAAVPPRLALATKGSELKRFAVAGASATLGLQIAEISIERGAKEIIIELQPFVRTLKNKRGLFVLGQSLRQATKAMLLSSNAQSIRWIEDRPRPDEDILPSELKLVYPPQLIETPNPDALVQFIERANSLSVRVTFVAMPVSETAAAYIGDKYRSAFLDRITDFEGQFGVDVWNPAYAWPDENFRDRSHFNLTGRARFVRELVGHLERGR